MNANNNPVRKSIILMLVFLIAFAAIVTTACDEGPTGTGTVVIENHPLTGPSGSNPIDSVISAAENLCNTAGYHKDASGNCVK